jgi:tetratricopeptide (TPR) repeat protein
MPESTCLHIQDHESAPIRVVDIPWISVRIGRAAFCEVRLTSEDLADEACRLYRRGRLWHLVPAGAKGTNAILLEGRAVDSSRLLPFNVPFRIGRFCLTLRQDRAVDPDWGMYPGSVPEKSAWTSPAFDDGPTGRGHATRADLVVEPQTIDEAPFKPEWRQPTAKGPINGPEIPAAGAVKDRWETKWRVAGAELKARAQRSATRSEPRRAPLQAGFESVPLKEPRAPRAQPTARSHIEPPARPVETPARPVETPARPVETTRSEAKVDPRWNIPAAEPAVPRSPSPQAEDEWLGVGKPAEALWSDVQQTDTDDRSANDAPALPPEIEPCALVADRDERNAKAADESWYEMPVLVLPPETVEADAVAESPVQSASPSRKRPAKSSSASDADRPRPGASRSRKNGEAKRAGSSRERIDGEPRPIAARQPARDPAVKPAQWPSAKDILASHRPRVNPQANHLPAAVRTASASLTHSREPAHWSLPRWLLGPPMAAFVAAVGLLGGILSWWWASDAYAVSLMTGRLMSADGRAQRAALPESVAPPDGTWTRSTAQHLAHWAIFTSRNEPGQPASSRDVAALVNRALEISPLNPTARLAAAQLEPREVGAPISQRSLGLSRDAISLSWCARRLLAAGDKEGALKIYEKALKVATASETSRVAAPPFSDDPGVPRYLLPGEDRVQDIVREIDAKKEWTFQEWSTALPKDPVNLLAAARLLKKQGRSDADTLLELVLDDHRQSEGAKTTTALVRAARAEAFALKARWRDSEEQYRLAIDLIDDDTIKRSWWFNLADIERELDDESQRQSALRAALADASDEISRRATEIQRASNGRPLSPLSGPKAN